jgi:hypothetical protein
MVGSILRNILLVMLLFQLVSFGIFEHDILVFAMAQAGSHQPVTVEAWLQSLFIPSGICCG